MPTKMAAKAISSREGGREDDIASLSIWFRSPFGGRESAPRDNLTNHQAPKALFKLPLEEGKSWLSVCIQPPSSRWRRDIFLLSFPDEEVGCLLSSMIASRQHTRTHTYWASRSTVVQIMQWCIVGKMRKTLLFSFSRPRISKTWCAIDTAAFSCGDLSQI